MFLVLDGGMVPLGPLPMEASNMIADDLQGPGPYFSLHFWLAHHPQSAWEQGAPVGLKPVMSARLGSSSYNYKAWAVPPIILATQNMTGEEFSRSLLCADYVTVATQPLSRRGYSASST
jgi:hypothetical protein